MGFSVSHIWYSDLEYWHLIDLAEIYKIVLYMYSSSLHFLTFDFIALVVYPQAQSFLLQTISHHLCLRSGLFLPCRSVFGGHTRNRWCHDGYRLQRSCQLQMYRPPSLLRYDLSLRVQREHLLDDLVSRMQVWSDAAHYSRERFLVCLGGKYLWPNRLETWRLVCIVW